MLGSVRTGAATATRRDHGEKNRQGVHEMAKDPVCGMEVREGPQAIQSAYRGNTFFFCSPGCKTNFEQNPEEYVNR
jgi:YHS domain-containing protein